MNEAATRAMYFRNCSKCKSPRIETESWEDSASTDTILRATCQDCGHISEVRISARDMQELPTPVSAPPWGTTVTSSSPAIDPWFRYETRAPQQDAKPAPKEKEMPLVPDRTKRAIELEK